MVPIALEEELDDYADIDFIDGEEEEVDDVQLVQDLGLEARG